MIIDSSALMAVLLGEADAERFSLAMASDPAILISAGTLMELGVVTQRVGGSALERELDAAIQDAGLVTVPVDEEHVRQGRAGHRKYGRGSGHPARLNFGDCFAYALTKVTGEPLLYKGDDFTQTDIRSALEGTAG